MAKENSIKMKREPTVWENIFANDTLAKDMISEIYKELTSLQEDTKPNEKINNLNLIKLKTFCMAKENISKMKREPILGEIYLTMTHQTRV